jgi:hypothetical protein
MSHRQKAEAKQNKPGFYSRTVVYCTQLKKYYSSAATEAKRIAASISLPGLTCMSETHSFAFGQITSVRWRLLHVIVYDAPILGDREEK